MTVPSVTYIKDANTDQLNGGKQIVVEGSSFTGTTGATVGGVAVQSFDVMDDNHLEVVLPAKAVGTYDLVVTNADGSSATGNSDKINYFEEIVKPAGDVAVWLVRDDYGDTFGAYTSLNAAQSAALAGGYNLNNIVSTVGVVSNGNVTSWIDPS